MRVAVNALFLRYPHTGIGQYLLHVITALGNQYPDDEYRLLLPAGDLAAPACSPNVTIEQVSMQGPGGHRLEKFLWEQRVFPQAGQRRGAEVLHVPYFATPFRQPLPTVVTIHDVIPLRLPVYKTSGAVHAYHVLVSRASRRAPLILTVSEYSKRDIQATLGIPAERIRVVLEAAGPQFRPVEDPLALAAARQRYGLGERYLLYVGGFDDRKNVGALIKAFARLLAETEEPALQLMVAGDTSRLGGATYPDWRPLAEQLGVMERIRTGHVADADLPPLYSAATAFVYPSLYEGFGLNPLEAMACGAPIICSNRTSLPEVVGSAALLVDPQEPAAMAAAMARVLSDAELRAALRQQSLAQAAQFSWERAARETHAVFEEALTLNP
jgi:glycosyltransferase involved in cell wall biosynthesis